MILQLGALLQPLLEAGIGFGTQFLQRELSRDSRRAEKDLLKAQARAAGAGGSFVQSQSPGTVAPPFSTVPTLPMQRFVAGPGNIPFTSQIPFTDLVRGNTVTVPRNIMTGALNGAATRSPVPGFATSFQERFVLDKASGCLRPKQAGEKGPTFKLDRNGDFVRVKPRRMNPLNPRAAKRASRRIDATLNAVKQFVKIANKKNNGVSAGNGKVVSFKTSGKKRKCS